MIYPNLSGHITDYRDGGLTVPPLPVTTENVVLLGTGTDGPGNAPTAVTNPNSAPNMYGAASSANGKATLLPGIFDCAAAGCTAVEAMRIGGDYAAYAAKPATTPANTGYVVIEDNQEFDVPDPTLVVNGIAEGDDLRFALSGFSDNMKDGAAVRVETT